MSVMNDTLFHSALPTSQLLEHLGLLCRTSPKTRKVSLQRLVLGQGAGARDKTCIEGGESLLVTIRAGTAAGIGIASAKVQKPAKNVRHWKRWSIQDPSQTGESLIFGMPNNGDWNLAKAHLGDCSSNTHALTELRLRGGVYMATQSEPETGLSWLSFGLHKGQSPRETLASLGQPKVWMKFSSYLSNLLGRPITERARPWSIAIPVSTTGNEHGLIRVGSTNWSRLPENAEKSSMFARQVDDIGGDGRLAEGIYSLVSRYDTSGNPIGVAAEFDFKNGRLIGSQYTLRVPQ